MGVSFHFVFHLESYVTPVVFALFDNSHRSYGVNKFILYKSRAHRVAVGSDVALAPSYTH